jgi:hypothetical protein
LLLEPFGLLEPHKTVLLAIKSKRILSSIPDAPLHNAEKPLGRRETEDIRVVISSSSPA